MTLSESWMLLPLLLATGLFSGLLSGMLGIGGGIFLVPILFIIFTQFGVTDNLVMHLCIGTSTTTIVATSLRSVIAHHQKGAVDWQVLKTWGPWLGSGAVVGVMVATSLRSDTLMAVFGGVGTLMGFYMLAGNPKWVLSDRLPSVWIYAPVSSAIGFICAMMGIGGGIFGVPALTAFSKPLSKAIATAAGFGFLISLPAGITYLLSSPLNQETPWMTVGLVNLPAFAIVVLMTFFTVPLGARLTHVLPTNLLRKLFAFFIILAALNMLRKALF